MIKVFLAEEEYIICQGMKKHLAWQQNGFELIGDAGNVELAYKKIQELNPNIVIVDLSTPFADALKLCKSVKQRLPELKVIIISGYDDLFYAKEALAVGATEYLLKPVTAERLLDCLLNIKQLVINEDRERLYSELVMKENHEIKLVYRSNFFKQLTRDKYSSS